MDARQLTVFTADVQAQMQLIQRVATLLELRAEGLQREDAARLESVAYHDKLIANLNRARDVLPLLKQDIERFLQQLQ